MKRLGIWTSEVDLTDDYRQELVELLAETRECDESEITDDDVYEYAYDNVETSLDDEKHNLDKELGGQVVALVNTHVWNGHGHAAEPMGTNLNSIFELPNDHNGYEYDFYSDGENVVGEMKHHDGTHFVTFRLVKASKNEDLDKKTDKVCRLWCGSDKDREKALSLTSSLHNDVAGVYGWERI